MSDQSFIFCVGADQTSVYNSMQFNKWADYSYWTIEYPQNLYVFVSMGKVLLACCYVQLLLYKTCDTR